MFKKGQLVRSARTGLLRMVVFDYGDGFVYTKNLSYERTYFIPRNELELIGNNYQPKPQHGVGGEW